MLRVPDGLGADGDQAVGFGIRIQLAQALGGADVADFAGFLGRGGLEILSDLGQIG